MSTMRQQPDGTWAPAEPIGYVPGIDWEVYGKRGQQQTAVAYDGATELARVTGRGFRFRVRLALANRRIQRATR